MAATGIVVSVSMGVMKPVLEKLATLMGDKYKRLKGLRKEVSFLMQELRAIQALLEKMDTADELDSQAKNWRNDIIDMSYDIEDYIDDFMNCICETDDKVGILRKASHCLKTIKDRYRIANQIKKIKIRVIQTSQRHERYKFDASNPSTTPVIHDPRLSALYKVDSALLVGIDTQKEELVKWAMDEEQRLKVASIVGFGGLGKTTLANEVYREVGVQFNCKVFVSISQKPDITKLLNSILSQLQLHTCSNVCDMDLINRINKHLQNKRYFIVIDDLWDKQAWNVISCAFPQNNLESRVMITTRNENVARASYGNYGFIHKMKSLSEQDSRKLFFDRIFGSEDACPPNFTEVSCTILKKCCGVPLAILTMASMLACQPTRSKGQWEYIQNSLAAEFESNPTYKDMMYIIDLSYKNLPHHLKACFLYLGIYPEDHHISRVQLVRRWVAEGFVSCSPVQDVWAVADNYFNELLNRSMIQPVTEYDDDYGINVTHCKVHDMMLELIVRKCREDNFISLIDDPQIMLRGQDKVIRRLTLDLRGVEGGITIMASTSHLSQVRSLNIFSGDCRFAKLVEFKFMRVLFLDVDRLNTEIDLTGINQFVQLRYLDVRGNDYKVVLPAQIRGLRFLETLDFRKVNCNYLPEIVDVPRLSHLSVQRFSALRLPDGIGKMKSLRTLSGFNLAMSSLESITGLGKLTDLSELILDFKRGRNGCVLLPKSTLITALRTSLEKLGNLKILILHAEKPANSVYYGDALLGSLYPFCNIERLGLLLLTFSSVPRCIGHLHYLRDLALGTKWILQEDVNMMGTRLTSLVRLWLWVVRLPTERIVIGGSTGFKALKRFQFHCDGVSSLTLETGAMPELLELELVFHPLKWDKTTPVGLQLLPSLKKILLRKALLSNDMGVFKEHDDEMRGMFQEVANTLPARPKIIIDGGALIRPDVDEDS